MRRDIVFVHIPKTAGTSLRNALEKAADDHAILRDYGGNPITSPKLHDLVHVQRKPSLFREVFKSGPNGILLSGHFPASRYWESFHAESFVTFIRDPVDRVVSEYNHFVSHENWTSPIEEFVAKPRFRNVISKFLAHVDLERFGFIGIVEDIPAVLPALEAHLDTRLSLRHENAGDYAGGTVQVTDAQRAMIAELNLDDIGLYCKLRRERGRAPRALGADAAVGDSYLGRVMLKQSGELVGWLCNTAREFIAEVEIFDGDRSIASAPADRYNERAKKLGYSRTGLCGFRVDLQSLDALLGSGAGHSLRVKAKDSGYELKGSPLA